MELIANADLSDLISPTISRPFESKSRWPCARRRFLDSARPIQNTPFRISASISLEMNRRAWKSIHLTTTTSYQMIRRPLGPSVVSSSSTRFYCGGARWRKTPLDESRGALHSAHTHREREREREMEPGRERSLYGESEKKGK